MNWTQESTTNSNLPLQKKINGWCGLNHFQYNVAPSEENTQLDGGAYLGWKISCFVTDEKVIADPNTTGYLWDQCCQLRDDQAQ